MQRTTPPYRADHVGSLLRPAPLKEAREKRAKRRDHAGAAQGGGRPRDREGHQEAGGHRPQARDRRRIPPLVVAFRFLPRPRRRDLVHHRSRHPVRRRADQGRGASRSTPGSASPAIRCWSISNSSRRTPRVTPKMTIPAPSTLPLPPGPRRDQQAGLSRPRSVLRRSRRRLPQGDPRLLRRRLPLSATRRHRLGDGVRSERARAFQGARRRSRHAAEALREAHQRRARRQAGRHDHHHAFVPRQFPLHLHRLGRLRVRRRASCSATPISTAISSNTTASAPAASSRCGSFRRARSSSCSASSPRRAASWKRRTTSSAASTRRPNTSRSTSSACRRNAASPRPRKATCWPRTSNGRSCG